MNHSESMMSSGRISSLSDGVFAVAMTLLVVNLNIPENIRLSDTELHVVLMNQTSRFSNYIISFLLTAVFWISHHRQHHYIKRTDTVHLWINIFILMFIVLVPFSTSLTGDYGGSTTAEVFFAGNMMIVGLLFRANWVYAIRNHRLIETNTSKEIIADGMWRCSLFNVISLMAVVFAFVIPKWSSLAYLLFPAGIYLRHLVRS